MVLESKGEKTFKMVLQLLKCLWVSTVITVDQMKRVRPPLELPSWLLLRMAVCLFVALHLVVRGASI